MDRSHIAFSKGMLGGVGDNFIRDEADGNGCVSWQVRRIAVECDGDGITEEEGA